MYTFINEFCTNFVVAFSIFAFAEYVVAVANMGYYWTIVDDLPTEQIVVMRPGTFPSSAELPQATNESTDGQLKGTFCIRSIFTIVNVVNIEMIKLFKFDH